MKRKIFSILFALVLVVSMSLVTAVPTVAVPETIVLGGDTATAVKAQGSSLPGPLGTSSWAAVSGDSTSTGKMELYIDPTSPPFDSLGAFTIDDIASISYWTNKPGAQGDPDFYLAIYTVGDAMVWYGYRLNAEPLYSNNLDAPANQWNQWNTGGATNQLTFFDSNRTVTGFYNGPTLADLQAGSINWGDYPTSGSTYIIDYGAETVKYITFQTGTPWCGTFEGNIDAIMISLTGGASLTIDLEEYYNEVWVNDDATEVWYALPGNFATIQDGIDNVASDGTVNVAAGTYPENVTIDKTLTLEGAQAGVNARGRTGSESIINAQGTPIAVLINGAETVATFNGFTVDNYDTIGILAGAFKTVLQEVPLGDDPVAVHILNNIVKPPTVAPPHNNNIQVGAGTTGTVIGNEVSGALLESPDWSGSGIIVASSNDILVSNNYVHNSEGGIQILGYAEYQGRPAAENNLIENNLVEGNECGISVQGNSIGTIIRYNDVLNNDVGIGSMAYDLSWPEHSTPSGTEVHYNNIVDNKDYGVESGVWGSHTGNVLAEEVDATNNWWNSASGPTHASNSGGAGDPVTDNVVFSPWLGDTFDTTPMTFVELVTGTDPSPVELQDEAGNPIATVDISGGDAAQGTIAARSEEQDPEPGETSLAIGTGKTGVVFVDVQVTGYASGTAHIIVPYPDVDPDDGIVDGTDIDENTLGLYYWDDNADMWRIAGNNTVDTANNIVSGYIPVVALTGTPIGLGGYPADEATVAIDSIPDLSYSGNDTVDLIITTNTAKLGAVTIDLTFNSTVVEVLGGENSQFDSLTVNPVFGTQTARFVASQLGPAGVDATGGAVLAQVRLKAVGNTGSSSPLTLSVVTLKDNDGISIPRVTPTPGTATIGGLGDANSDGAVDVYDCVYIARVIAGIPGFIPNTLVMDVSGDGTVDAWDCTYLARHLAGIPGYELGG